MLEALIKNEDLGFEFLIFNSLFERVTCQIPVYYVKLREIVTSSWQSGEFGKACSGHAVYRKNMTMSEASMSTKVLAIASSWICIFTSHNVIPLHLSQQQMYGETI